MSQDNRFSQFPRHEYYPANQSSQTPARSSWLALLLCSVPVRKLFAEPTDRPPFPAHPTRRDLVHRNQRPQKLKSKHAPFRTRTRSSGSESSRHRIMLPVTQASLSEIDDYSTSMNVGYLDSMWRDEPFYRHSYGGHMVHNQSQDNDFVRTPSHIRHSWDVNSSRGIEELQAYEILNRASEFPCFPLANKNGNDNDYYDMHDDLLSRHSHDTYDILLGRAQRLDDYTPHALEPIQENLPVFHPGAESFAYNGNHVLRRQQGSRTLRQDMKQTNHAHDMFNTRPNVRTTFVHAMEPTSGRSSSGEPKGSSSSKYSTRGHPYRNGSQSSNKSRSPASSTREENRSHKQESRPRRGHSHRASGHENTDYRRSNAALGTGRESRRRSNKPD